VRQRKEFKSHDDLRRLLDHRHHAGDGSAVSDLRELSVKIRHAEFFDVVMSALSLVTFWQIVRSKSATGTHFGCRWRFSLPKNSRKSTVSLKGDGRPLPAPRNRHLRSLSGTAVAHRPQKAKELPVPVSEVD
jgi:hypothetical protein